MVYALERALLLIEEKRHGASQDGCVLAIEVTMEFVECPTLGSVVENAGSFHLCCSIKDGQSEGRERNEIKTPPLPWSTMAR